MNDFSIPRRGKEGWRERERERALRYWMICDKALFLYITGRINGEETGEKAPADFPFSSHSFQHEPYYREIGKAH